MLEPEPSLSDREREILRLVATGASNKEIAAQLVISPNTVKVHLRNIFSKIGAASRTEAALYALRAGFVEDLPQGETAVATAVQPARPHWLWAVSGLVLVVVLAGAALLAARTPRTEAGPQAGSEPAPAVSWQTAPSLPEGRAGMGSAVYDNALYLVGGETAQGITGDVLCFSPAKGQWEERASRPTPARDAPAAVLGERIYVAGGLSTDGRPSDRFEVYDPRAGHWESRAPLPRALSGAALAAMEGQLYLLGGRDGVRARAEVYRYDPQANAWSEASPMPYAGTQVGAVAVEGKIVVWISAGSESDRVETYAFYPQRDRQGEKAWEARTALPQAQSGLSAAALAGQVFAAGGAQKQAWVYQVQQDRWSALASLPAVPGYGAVMVALENRLHLVGGQTAQGFSPAHYSLQALYTILFPLVP